MENKKFYVIAHRGASGLVQFENTLESYQKAIDLHCDGIECDVRKTKDDVIIMSHDPNIKDMIINEHTYQELNEYTTSLGYHLPTLIETLNLVKGKIIIDIEIKEEGYEDKILNEILSVLNPDEFFVRSFFDNAIKRIYELNNSVRTILLTGLAHPKHLIKTRYSEVFPKRRLKKCHAYAVSPYYEEMILKYPKRLHKLGYKVIVWTVNDKENMKKIINDVDGIITNYPNLLFEVLNENNSVQ